MNGFPFGAGGFGGMDPSKLNPVQLKAMLGLLGNMSDDQLKNTMKGLGLEMEPSVLRSFIEKLKGASDDDINKFKEQFSKGKVNMNEFSKLSKYEKVPKDAEKLCDENKFNEAIELCENNIKELSSQKAEDEKSKSEISRLLAKIYDAKTEARYKSQDLDDCIKECQEAIEAAPSFSLYKRMGICFFKKGKHIKARDAFLKGKEKYPEEKDELLEKYLKMALEEIENY